MEIPKEKEEEVIEKVFGNYLRSQEKQLIESQEILNDINKYLINYLQKSREAKDARFYFEIGGGVSLCDLAKEEIGFYPKGKVLLRYLLQSNYAYEEIKKASIISGLINVVMLNLDGKLLKSNQRIINPTRNKNGLICRFELTDKLKNLDIDYELLKKSYKETGDDRYDKMDAISETIQLDNDTREALGYEDDSYKSDYDLNTF